MAEVQVKASQVSGGVGMQNLGDSTLGSSAASITLSSISSSYKALDLLYQLRGDGAFANEYIDGQLGTGGGSVDTGANYDNLILNGDNSTVAASATNGQTAARLGVMSAASATRGSMFGAGFTRFPNYAGTTAEKSFMSQGGSVDSTAANCDHRIVSNNWRNTGGITSTKVFPHASTNFVTGSRVTLQGIQ